MSASEPAQVLKNILADPEFQTDWRELLDQWLLKRWKVLADWLDRLPGVDRGLILALCLLVLAGIAWSVVRGFREGAASGLGTTTAPPEDLPPPSAAAELAARARALAAQGRQREAARTLQQAVYRALADRDGLSWDVARADWEWVARLAAESGLDEFTAQAQLAAYGEAPPEADSSRGTTPEGFEALWSRAERWVAA